MIRFNDNCLIHTEEAEKYSRILMKELERFKRIDFDPEPVNSLPGHRHDPRLSTSPLFGEARGQMFGVLVCTSTDNPPEDCTPTEPIVLKAFSGQFNGVWDVPGWAPPLLDPAEFKAAAGRADPPIKQLTAEINSLPHDAPERGPLSEQRRGLSQRHMREIHEMYTIRNFAGETTDLFSIFNGRPGIPAGTGDCCAPKLLNLAVRLGLKPLSLAEFYWGRANRSGTKQHGRFYPPCADKCEPLMGFMLRGAALRGAGSRLLDIIYSDDSIVVINKPAGMLSVPGRGPNKSDSAAARIRKTFPECIEQPSVHRLDMDTSGLLVFALTAAAHRNLSIQFQNSEVRKKYTAVLEGSLAPALGSSGRIELSFRLDPDNRPYQIWDPVNGKNGVTLWKKLDSSQEPAGAAHKDRTRIEFEPLTGRTHQLRLHAADSRGLGVAIVGDRLYGSSSDAQHAAGVKMLLHASEIVFRHPDTGSRMEFTSPPPF